MATLNDLLHTLASGFLNQIKSAEGHEEFIHSQSGVHAIAAIL